ncbi:MAG TPA: hypothetical protein VKV17_21620 [Bryobacteraceae bacterium]|nr:hypothetical protein [Bryobacteraceae bacterium]
MSVRIDREYDTSNGKGKPTIRFVEENHGSLYPRALEHPRLGALNGCEYVVLIAAHSRRHTAQIVETRAAVGAN